MREYKLEELVKIAKRENNSIRPYLYVDPLQGKHIPVDPRKSIELFKAMAKILDERCRGERVLTIGFAETATAIGLAVSEFSDTVVYCTHTTREKYTGAKYLYFTESHSHATEQSLLINGYKEIINNVDRIVFVEDEVTTGNTIYKLIMELRKEFPDKMLKFGILSILNSMSSERIIQLEKEEIFCLFISKLPFEYQIDVINGYTYENSYITEKSIEKIDINEINTDTNFRYISSKYNLKKMCSKFVSEIMQDICLDNNVRSILVLGTEEFMYLPMKLALAISEKYPHMLVRFHATTRSPILVSRDKQYPLHSRYDIASEYDDERKTFIYNLTKYDVGIIVTDSNAKKDNLFRNLKEALNKAGCHKLYFNRVNYEK